MRFPFVFIIIFLFGSAQAQIRPTAGPFGNMPDDGFYNDPYNRMTTMDEKFGYLSTVLAERLSLCGFRVNPALNFYLVSTYYQLKFRGITESFDDQCRSLECLGSKELSFIMNDLDNSPQSVPYLMKSYKIEKLVAEDLMKTFLTLGKNFN